MRAFQRLTLAIATLSMFCGLAVLAEDPVQVAPQCNHRGSTGRGKGPPPKCEPISIQPCERIVCDSAGLCQWHCEPIPGCVP
jgi:hypothetical protein